MRKPKDNNTLAFLVFVRAGLWRQEAIFSEKTTFDFDKVYSLAQEQSVVGLVAEGLESVKDLVLPKEKILPFIATALQLEKSNIAMNSFIVRLYNELKKEGIFSLLVKGQGIAQCYNRPLWRACGDIDLLLDRDNYVKARNVLSSKARIIEEENENTLHLAMSFDRWSVELHGTSRSELWRALDRKLDFFHNEICRANSGRFWDDGGIEVPLPDPNNDVIYVFNHILQHFFKGGVGLRQLCDWCRLLWFYKDEIDEQLLANCIKTMDLISEWRAFAALSVEWLGMSKDVIPLYSEEKKWKRKALRILEFILETGNFGHNREKQYKNKYPYLVCKLISFWFNTRDSIRHSLIFPLDSVRVWWNRLIIGIITVIKGK